MVPDPLAHKVALRHQTAVRVRGESAFWMGFEKAGRIAANDLATVLEPKLGAVTRLKFLPLAGGTIAWSAERGEGEVVSGRMGLRVFVAADNEVIAGVEVTVDTPDSTGARVEQVDVALDG